MSPLVSADSSRQQLTLGVLGHVDHGKTALVRALTGIETDRLADERERGLSIVAGYAFIDTPGRCVDLIDVPGHEAFIRAMIGAASGIDSALLVIAANEGIMPQTREHVAVAGLLGLSSGIVALSKCDLLSETELDVVEEEVRAFIDGTFLHAAAIVRVSATKEQGVDALREALLRMPARPADDPESAFFMPVDRSFSISGFGRVVTGTVHAGPIAPGDELVVSPGGMQASVRGIQEHGRDVQGVSAGARAALNLRIAAGARIEPGMVVGREFAVQASRRLDVLIEPLAGFGEILGNGRSVRVLIGTAEAQARLRILERDGESPQRLLAQLRCDREVSACVGMRFVLRRNSPSDTIGGGVVIDAAAPRRRRYDRSSNAALAALAGESRAGLFAALVAAAGTAGLDRERAAARMCVPPDVVDRLAADDSIVAVTPQLYCAVAALESVEGLVLDRLQHYHAAHPHHAGMRQADLAADLAAAAHEAVVRAAYERLRSRGAIAAEGEMWRVASFDASANLSRSQRQLAERIEALFVESGFVAPSLSSVVAQSAAARETLRFLLETGRIVRLQTRDRAGQLALHADAIRDVQARIRNRYPYPSEFAVSDIRDLLETTRRHAVPLLEHLDAIGFTLRRGDMRQIRK